MKSKLKLNDMVNGWFVGNFNPSLIKTEDVEVAIKKYQAKECEDRHYHKIATEVTVVLDGEVEMNGVKCTAGDIVVMEPFKSTDFIAISDATIVVVKHPGATNDKYIGSWKKND